MVLIACALAMAMANASLCIWPVLPEPPTNYKGGKALDHTFFLYWRADYYHLKYRFTHRDHHLIGWFNIVIKKVSLS